MSDDTAEVINLENAFGAVTDRRVIYYRSKWWFSGGSKEVVSCGASLPYALRFPDPLPAVPLLLMGLAFLAGHGVPPLLAG